MGTLGSYYLNGPDLATSTGIFTDVDLTTCAPDGFYSQGTVVRELDTCVLLPATVCSNCATACRAVTSNPNTSTGLYLISVDVGTLAGAVRVEFKPDTIPDGIRIIYNDVVFNRFSSAYDGHHVTSEDDGLTYMGETGGSCPVAATTYALAEKELYDGSYTANGNTTNVIVSAGSLSLSAATPQECVAYFPKLNNTPTTCLIQISQPCNSSDWDLEVDCAAAITNTLQSTHVFPVDDCATVAPYIDTIYLGKVVGSPSVPNVHDWVYSDENAAQYKAAGDYKVKDASDIEYLITVSVYGVITTVTTCP